MIFVFGYLGIGAALGVRGIYRYWPDKWTSTYELGLLFLALVTIWPAVLLLIGVEQLCYALDKKRGVRS